MSSEAEVWILDVGHGNGAVVLDGDFVSIIDGGGDDTLLRFLESQGISRAAAVLVSHVDADHLAGASLLLSNPEFHVDVVYVNPDPRETELWRDFVSVMIDAKARGTQFFLELTTENPHEVVHEDVRLEVLAPSQEVAIQTNAGRDVQGRRLTANSMSAVIRIWHQSRARILLPGDIDDIGLAHLLEGDTPSADVLVFPHHGGNPGGGNPRQFAESLTSAVAPNTVVFSLGRRHYDNPQPEVVAAVMQSAPGVHIACTQLSVHCAATIPAAASPHVHPNSRGATQRLCCAGTLTFGLAADAADWNPGPTAHLRFIGSAAPAALCLVRT